MADEADYRNKYHGQPVVFESSVPPQGAIAAAHHCWKGETADKEATDNRSLIQARVIRGWEEGI
jgi:hypothetical protein